MTYFNISHYNFDLTLKPIGRGSYSQVFKGVDTKDGKEVAVKVLNSGRNFDREIQLLKCVQHENLVCVYDIVEKDDQTYIIMEYCSSSLTNVEKPCLENRWKKYFQEILAALVYLQDQNIYHRDLKPENILLVNDTIKLCDFTFARTLENTNIVTATICGSPFYMAPELLLYKKCDIKSDIWSLGVMSYHFLYGFPPFLKYQAPIDIINSLKSYKIPFPAFNINKIQLSPSCIDLLKKMLQKNLASRISWSELRLSPWISGKSISEKSGERGKSVPHVIKTKAESVPISIYGFGGIPSKESVEKSGCTNPTIYSGGGRGLLIGNVQIDDYYSPMVSEEQETKAISCPAAVQTPVGILNTSINMLRGVFKYI